MKQNTDRKNKLGEKKVKEQKIIVFATFHTTTIATAAYKMFFLLIANYLWQRMTAFEVLFKLKRFFL